MNFDSWVFRLSGSMVVPQKLTCDQRTINLTRSIPMFSTNDDKQLLSKITNSKNMPSAYTFQLDSFNITSIFFVVQCSYICSKIHASFFHTAVDPTFKNSGWRKDKGTYLQVGWQLQKQESLCSQSL